MTEAEQLPLLPERAARPRRVRGPVPLAETDPVAQVVIDSPLPHLDRVFDYAVPAALDEQARVGCRVRVRFAGKLTDGYLVGRTAEADHGGELRPLERVVGTDLVLEPGILVLAREVAQRYAGTVSDVLRAAIPPRHARAEAVEVEPSTWMAEADSIDAERWSAYDSGPALLQRLADPGAAPTRAVWSLAPATRWVDDVAAAVRAVLGQDRGSVVVVVPDARDIAAVLDRFEDAVRAGAVATLTADLGPERRYREFLRILRGGARLVVGTRAAVFAPVVDPRLLVLWDDGDDALCEPHAPYWDARDVLALRAHLTGCDLLVGSPARSVVTQQWCRTGWARSVQATRTSVGERGPRVRALAREDAARDPAAAAARIPHPAWQAARSALERGPVLVQVPRRGYLPMLACQRCRAPARCTCGGPLRIAGAGKVPSCEWCGTLVGDWRCRECGDPRLRAVSVGVERTAEEIGRAFPGVPVVSSHAGRMVGEVDDRPQVVVATPGAEPRCSSGYRAVLLLDARAQLQRPSLETTEDTARRWFAAAALAEPGGQVVVTADNALPIVQSLLRWDAPWLADRELAERASAGLPPATRMAALLGAAADIEDVARALTVPHRLLGPVPREGEDRHRGLVVVAREDGAALATQLRAITATRSAQSKTAPVHVRLDPRDL